MSLVHDVIAELDAERERIWLTLPEDVRDLGNGIIPRLTGPKKQYFTSLLYADGEARTLADEVLWGLIEISRKPGADLDTLKMVVNQIVDYKADFFDFVGLPLICKWTHRYAEGARAAESLEEFREVTGAALSYMNRVHMWIQSVFPWGIASAFPRADARQTA
ncbi:hypothetical protein ATK74_2170 [Propionicimonas paludicola]|uniref:Cucumopine synthase C-terminal helical bundle domain-containing protein n=1 Tax=Propionicimonas paludicola TaxID=185243 RepID=A0A2A9CT30_9ACTN|nr:hypothetical protein [Propionicimonas paludicola]PFG17597.1 hypothetical protein ATK74_2170 [Propionicimonas paludicola]